MITVKEYIKHMVDNSNHKSIYRYFDNQENVKTSYYNKRRAIINIGLVSSIICSLYSLFSNRIDLSISVIVLVGSICLIVGAFNNIRSFDHDFIFETTFPLLLVFFDGTPFNFFLRFILEVIAILFVLKFFAINYIVMNTKDASTKTQNQE